VETVIKGIGGAYGGCLGARRRRRA